MSSRNTIPSKTEILGFLRECGFDPRNQTEMRALTIVSKPGYCEIRAMELINEAQLALTKDCYNQHYEQCIAKAIQLLTLARTIRKRDEASFQPLPGIGDEPKDGADRR